MRIPTECEPYITDDRLSEYSLIAILEYISLRKTKDTNLIQQYYKVSDFDISLFMPTLYGIIYTV